MLPNSKLWERGFIHRTHIQIPPGQPFHSHSAGVGRHVYHELVRAVLMYVGVAVRRNVCYIIMDKLRRVLQSLCVRRQPTILLEDSRVNVFRNPFMEAFRKLEVVALRFE